jgi:hypothetical protein
MNGCARRGLGRDATKTWEPAVAALGPCAPKRMGHAAAADALRRLGAEVKEEESGEEEESGVEEEDAAQQV